MVGLFPSGVEPDIGSGDRRQTRTILERLPRYVVVDGCCQTFSQLWSNCCFWIDSRGSDRVVLRIRLCWELRSQICIFHLFEHIWRIYYPDISFTFLSIFSIMKHLPISVTWWWDGCLENMTELSGAQIYLILLVSWSQCSHHWGFCLVHIVLIDINKHLCICAQSGCSPGNGTALLNSYNKIK